MYQFIFVLFVLIGILFYGGGGGGLNLINTIQSLDDPANNHPEFARVRNQTPHRYQEFLRAYQESHIVFQKLIEKPLYHARYPYQTLRDSWQNVLNQWEELAVSNDTTYLQGDIAKGSRILNQLCQEKLQELRLYDTSPYRTTWIGEGQPKDPYDSKTVTFV